jgi:uncharacterized membrane protein YfcA
MSKRSGDRVTLATAMAIVACCAFPLLAATAGGALAAAGGVAVRYWPITALGIALTAWAGVKLGKVLRAGKRSLRERERFER